jgi:hypothetical protein
MDAKRQDLKIEVGEVRRWRCKLTMDGAPLTNVEDFEATIRFGPAPTPSQPFPKATVELGTSNGTITRSGEFFRWTLTDEASRLVVPGIWQMTVDPPSGKRTRIYEGVVRVSGELKSQNG